MRPIAAIPYRRDLSSPAEIWNAGTTRLLDYGETDASAAAAQTPAVLFVPSLINRAKILDLSQDRSLLRWLARAGGVRPLLLDWGEPGESERAFGLRDYIAGRIEPALEHIVRQTGTAPILVGYCMGGLLTLAAAVRRPDLTAGLALLATPWDFHADNGAQARLLAGMWPHLSPMFAILGQVPVDALQCLFSSLDPLLVLRKFAGFSELDQSSDAASRFVALEDWINDGVPLSEIVARECFSEWYGDNRPVLGEWRIDGPGDCPGSNHRARIRRPAPSATGSCRRHRPDHSPTNSATPLSRNPHLGMLG